MLVEDEEEHGPLSQSLEECLKRALVYSKMTGKQFNLVVVDKLSDKQQSV